MIRRLFASTWVIATALALAPASANADVSKGQCIKANASAQSSRREGRFSEARALLQVCSDSHCPAMVRDDCTQRLDELDRAQPTVLFDATDPAGHTLVDVTITSDGHPLTGHLDGRAIPLDPGQHDFEFQLAGQPVVRQSVLLNEGDKGRRVSVVLGEQAPPAVVPVAVAPVPSPSSPAHEGGLGTRKTVGLAVGGVGIAALVAGAVFGGLAKSAKSGYEQQCGSAIEAPAGMCNADGVSGHRDASTKATLSTAFFIGGGVATAAGVVLFVLPRTDGTSSTLGIGPGGLVVKGRFDARRKA